MKTTKTNQPETPEQPTDTAKAIDIPARPTTARKIDAVTIAEMAKLCAKMLTESEACRRLGIKPRTWFDFKSRAGRTQQFGDLLEAYRADRIEGLIDRIEKSANGIGVKYPDFRAALALLKITDQRRFGDSPAVEINTGQTRVMIAAGGEDNLRRLVAMFADQVRAEQQAKQGQIQPPAAHKQIAPAAGDVEVQVEPERVE